MFPLAFKIGAAVIFVALPSKEVDLSFAVFARRHRLGADVFMVFELV